MINKHLNIISLYRGQWTMMERYLFQQLVAAPVDGVIVTVLIDCTHTSE